MKTVIINGQNHKGSTYHIGKLLADKIGGEVTEFFLPRDFSDYCIGCAQCFSVAADKCPHFEKQQPILKAMDEADLIILTSPVYVYHVIIRGTAGWYTARDRRCSTSRRCVFPPPPEQV